MLGNRLASATPECARWRALPLLWSSAAGGAPGRMFLDVSLDWLVIGFAGLEHFPQRRSVRL